MIKKTITWEVLIGLTKKERASFLRFIHSPYFNQRQDLMLLAEFCVDQIELKVEEIDKEDLFYTIYPKSEIFDVQKIRLLLSYLQKKLELFIVNEEIRVDDMTSSRLLLSGMHKRGMSRNYSRKEKVIKAQNEKITQQDWAFYLGKYLLELHSLDSYFNHENKKEYDYSVLTDLLDTFYLSSRLRLFCVEFLYKSIRNSSYELQVPESVLLVAAQPRFLKIPVVSIYYHFIQILKGGADINFKQLKEDLFLNRTIFSEFEFYDIYTTIINFYIQKINQMKADRIVYAEELLELYRSGLELNLLLKDGELLATKYSNIVALSLLVGGKWVDWVMNDFLETYKPFLAKETRDTTYNLNRARVEYTLGNYDVALIALQDIRHDGLFNEITARILQIKIYWKKQELDLLSSALHSLKFFIKRRKVAGYHLNSWRNFIKFAQKMEVVNRFDSHKVEKLKEELQKQDVIAEKDWLQREVDKLLKNR